MLGLEAVLLGNDFEENESKQPAATGSSRRATKLIALEGLDSAIIIQQAEYLADWLRTDVGTTASVVSAETTVLSAYLKGALEDKAGRYGLHPLAHRLLGDALMMNATAEAAKALSEGEWVICPQWRHSYLAKRFLWWESCIEPGTKRRAAIEELHDLLKEELVQPEVAIFFKEDEALTEVKTFQREITLGLEDAAKRLGKKAIRIEPGHYKPELLHSRIRDEILRLYPDDCDLRRYVVKFVS